MTACAWCTGSHWLQDTEAFGPCTCCTPAALTAAEDDVGQLQSQISEVQDELAETNATLDDVRRELKLWEDDQTLADAWATLQAYLVSIGLPATPVTVANVHLSELVGLLQP